MWDKVASRKHVAEKIFSFGSGSDEVMLHGTVEYGMKDGTKSSRDWAARARMQKKDGQVKMSYYQGYSSG